MQPGGQVNDGQMDLWLYDGCCRHGRDNMHPYRFQSHNVRSQEDFSLQKRRKIKGG